MNNRGIFQLVIIQLTINALFLAAKPKICHTLRSRAVEKDSVRQYKRLINWSLVIIYTE